jgi:hypothetical protein
MTAARFEEAVTAMTLPENRFDVTIICCTDDYQADFWMTKLKHGSHGNTVSSDSASSSSRSSSIFPLVIAVSEDWIDPSGAGNGLGTLYAWKKACDYAKSSNNVNGNPDLESLLKQGTISAALYHTAGKGTRLAPLPASENNNKPGVVRRNIRYTMCAYICCCLYILYDFFMVVVVFVDYLLSILSHNRFFSFCSYGKKTN